MDLIIIATIITFLAYRILNSYFCKIISGLLWITAGAYQMDGNTDDWSFVITGVAFIALGIYLFMMVPYDMIRRED